LSSLDLSLLVFICAPAVLQHYHVGRLIRRGSDLASVQGPLTLYQLSALLPLLYAVFTNLPQRFTESTGLESLIVFWIFGPGLITQVGLAYSSYHLDRMARATDWTFVEFLKTGLRVQVVQGAFLLPLMLMPMGMEALMHFRPGLEAQLDRYEWQATTLFIVLIISAGAAAMFKAWRWTQPQNAPVDPELSARLGTLGERIGLVPHKVEVLPTRGGKVANAFLMGLRSGRQTVMLTDYLLEHLSYPQIEAVFAHEVGHAKLGHIRQRLYAALAAYVLLMGGAFGWPLLILKVLQWPKAVAFLPLVPLGLALPIVIGPLLRKQEFAADRWAGEATGKPELLADALEQLESLNQMQSSKLPKWLLPLVGHPITPLRIAALRAMEKGKPAEAEAPAGA
jgi:Zn-dependent protease with chaperone function